jgi:hypothetical protein
MTGSELHTTHTYPAHAATTTGTDKTTDTVNTATRQPASSYAHSIANMGDTEVRQPNDYAYTFSDIYHAAMNDKDFDYVFWVDVSIVLAFQYCFRGMGKLLVVCAIALIAFFGLSGFLIILPAVATFGTLWHAFNVVWGE